ncbi:hypothetical protein BDN72DRAFT_901795 [Pluteus cervinus]|uniref:Uncharacterized protein n=1 Tax=Pluteus cervinus TaxID=181527 RepID=A0ACD3AFR0_9AGAR|nr:hypothetical protein BDN72DRAFT_901795 [Pluteus cervinus]
MDWMNPPLVEIDLSGIREILNTNGWKEVSQNALNGIAGYGPESRKLEVGWCRQLLSRPGWTAA